VGRLRQYRPIPVGDLSWIDQVERCFGLPAEQKIDGGARTSVRALGRVNGRPWIVDEIPE
jgi:hypothetical protein